MIAYMPEIYPDELVYSWFSRYAAGSGHLANQYVLQELYHRLRVERNGNPIYWSDIRLLAGVKKEKMDRIIPRLLQQPDKKIVEEILNLV